MVSDTDTVQQQVFEFIAEQDRQYPGDVILAAIVADASPDVDAATAYEAVKSLAAHGLVELSETPLGQVVDITYITMTEKGRQAARQIDAHPDGADAVA